MGSPFDRADASPNPSPPTNSNLSSSGSNLGSNIASNTEPKTAPSTEVSNAAFVQSQVSSLAALRESEERYRSLVVATAQMVWSTDASGNVVSPLPSWTAYTGQSETEIQGQGWMGAVHPDDRADTAAAWSQALTTKSLYETEYRLRRADGHYRHFAVRGVPVLAPDGAVREWVGLCTDITQQKQREQTEHFLAEASRELARSLDYQTTLTTIAQLAVSQLADWCVVSILEDDGTVRPLAVAHVEPAKVERVWDLYRRYPDRPNASDGVLQVIRTGQPELVPDLPDDFWSNMAQDADHLRILRELNLKSYLVVPMQARGRCLGALTFVTAESGRRYDPSDLQIAEDLAQRSALAVDNARLFQTVERELEERKQVEAALHARAEELTRTTSILATTATILDKRNQELDQFAYVVSHDLKAPLRAIANLSQWLEEDLEDSLTDDTRHQMELLRGRVHRMEALIDGLLQYSRIGRVAVPQEVVSVNRLIQEVLDSLAPPPTFQFVIDENLPTFRTERLRLEQVFSNLISNAIKHHHRSQGQIQISAIDRGDRYEFSVTDDGPGIAPQFHSKVFGIFQTLEARDKVESTGIGLSLVKKIVENKGGTVQLESEPGHGATFRFTWRK